MDTVLIVLHVVGAVFIVGPMAILPMSALRSLRAGGASEVEGLAQSTQVFSLLSLGVAVLGFGALGTSDPADHFTFTTPWVLISVIAYAAALLLSLFVVVPAMRRGSAKLRESSAVATTSGSESGYAAIAAGSGIASFLLVIVVVLMVWKP